MSLGVAGLYSPLGLGGLFGCLCYVLLPMHACVNPRFHRRAKRNSSFCTVVHDHKKDLGKLLAPP